MVREICPPPLFLWKPCKAPFGWSWRYVVVPLKTGLLKIHQTPAPAWSMIGGIFRLNFAPKLKNKEFFFNWYLRKFNLMLYSAGWICWGFQCNYCWKAFRLDRTNRLITCVCKKKEGTRVNIYHRVNVCWMDVITKNATFRAAKSYLAGAGDVWRVVRVALGPTQGSQTDLCLTFSGCMKKIK